VNRVLRLLGLSIALCWAVFQLGLAFGPGLPDMVFLPLHALFAVAVAFALEPGLGRGGDGSRVGVAGTIDAIVSLVAIAAAFGIASYFVLNADALSRRIPLVFTLSAMQVAIGLVLIALLIEAARRTAGMGIVLVVLAFIAYGLWGHLLPSRFATTPLSLADFVDQMVYGTGGIFGVPISVSATYVFYFVLFAGMLEVSGGGRLFIDLALAGTRNLRGGAAKAAVASSGLMGMTSGSAVANVVSTGVFTIPLMKSAGYRPQVAGAVEALASTGAQIMPPLMGAAAFIMANTLGMPYSNIVVAATLPALLYFTVVFIAVDFEARKQGLRAGAVASPQLQPEGEGAGHLGRLHLLVPLVYLIVCVVSGRSLTMSALEAMGLVVVVSWLRRSTRLYPRALIEALAQGAARVVSVAIPCAVAGIIVGVVAQSGIGLRFTEFLVALSGQNLILALVVIMIGCLIMGMGLPTTAAYIMAGTLFAPALVRLGVPPLAAHMFVFYFACLSMITPPVALASYAAASIAKAGPGQTGWVAAWLGIPIFLLPFSFINHMELLGQGGVFETIFRFGWALLGMTAVVGATTGLFLVRSRWHESLALGVAGVAILMPSDASNIVGGAVLLAVLGLQGLRMRQRAAPADSA
jgi:TRAP transporter 4TM/12TM fusion protein